MIHFKSNLNFKCGLSDLILWSLSNEETYFEKVLSDIWYLSAISEVKRPGLNLIRTANIWSINLYYPGNVFCRSVSCSGLEPTQYLIFSAFDLRKLNKKMFIVILQVLGKGKKWESSRGYWGVNIKLLHSIHVYWNGILTWKATWPPQKKVVRCKNIIDNYLCTPIVLVTFTLKVP